MRSIDVYRSISGRLLAGYAAVIMLLALTWAVGAYSTAQLHARISHTVQVDDALLSNVTARIKLLDDEETGLRGYLLTGQRQFLEPYTQGRRQLPGLRAESTRLSALLPVGQPLVAGMLLRAVEWERWSQTVLRHPPADLRASAAVSQQGEGKRRFDRFRAASTAVIQAVEKNRQNDLLESERIESRMNWVSACIFLGALLLTVVIGWLTMRAVTRPLKALRMVAENIGSGGLSEVVEVEGAREFAGLAKSMDQMRLQLAQEAANRREAEEALRVLLIDRTRVADELIRANAELESFAYAVSHDLRAPLRSMDGFSQVLLDRYADRLDDRGVRYLNHVRGAAQEMGQLIDAILALSRVTRSEMQQKSLNLSGIAQSIANELATSAPLRRVSVTIAPGVVMIGDDRLMRAVLQNLLGNAWKFTSKRATACIEFGVTEQDGTVTCFVRDNGAGFDMEYANKLFTPFQRLHGAGDFEGTGVGLATVQRIVQRHGGRVWAEGSPGEGATFYFTVQGTREVEACQSAR
jgi:signal transduction histidine kinase